MTLIDPVRSQATVFARIRRDAVVTDAYVAIRRSLAVSECMGGPQEGLIGRDGARANRPKNTPYR